MNLVYLGLLQTLLRVREEQVHLSNGSTVADLLRLLAGKHGDAFTSTVLTSKGDLLPFAKVYVNDRDIDLTGRLGTKLEDKSEVCIVIASNDPSGG